MTPLQKMPVIAEQFRSRSPKTPDHWIIAFIHKVLRLNAEGSSVCIAISKPQKDT